MADSLVSSLAVRDKLRTQHEALATEFDTLTNDAKGIERKHQVNGEMAGIRFALKTVEGMPDATPPPKNAGE